jgi:hypothetical protein
LVAQASYVREIEESAPPQESRPTTVKRAPLSRPVNVIISVKPQAKKARTATVDALPITDKSDQSSTENPPVKHDSNNGKDNNHSNKITGVNDVLGALVSYSDESDDDDN